MPDDTERLNWLEKNPNVEISYDGWQEEPCWEAHKISGGKNDREWTLIAKADTLRECINNAIVAKKRKK